MFREDEPLRMAGFGRDVGARGRVELGLVETGTAVLIVSAVALEAEDEAEGRVEERGNVLKAGRFSSGNSSSWFIVSMHCVNGFFFCWFCFCLHWEEEVEFFFLIFAGEMSTYKAANWYKDDRVCHNQKEKRQKKKKKTELGVSEF